MLTWGIPLGLALVVLPARAHAEGLTYSLGLGFEVATGKYGTGTRTDSIYAPVTAAISSERFGFSLEIPYVYQSSSAANTRLFAGSGMHVMQMTPPSTSGGTISGSSTSSSTTSNTNRAQSGLGDIIAKAAYVLVPEGETMPRVRPYLQVKFPTGDQQSALGTGTFAEGGFLELSKQMGTWYSFAEAGYVVQQRSSVLDLKNYLSYDAGIGPVLGEKLLPMVILKGSTAPIAGSSDLLEVRLKLKYQFATQAGIEGYLSKGLTTNSPDYGGGLAAYYDF